jgi:hypothetical protein
VQTSRNNVKIAKKLKETKSSTKEAQAQDFGWIWIIQTRQGRWIDPIQPNPRSNGEGVGPVVNQTGSNEPVRFTPLYKSLKTGFPPFSTLLSLSSFQILSFSHSLVLVLQTLTT